MTLTIEHIKDVVLQVLGQIAPEANLAALEPDVSFREQLDIDSLDFLNFVIGVHEALHIDIPEIDYPELTTLNDCVTYLSVATSSRDQINAPATGL